MEKRNLKMDEIVSEAKRRNIFDYKTTTFGDSLSLESGVTILDFLQDPAVSFSSPEATEIEKLRNMWGMTEQCILLLEKHNNPEADELRFELASMIEALMGY